MLWHSLALFKNEDIGWRMAQQLRVLKVSPEDWVQFPSQVAHNCPKGSTPSSGLWALHMYDILHSFTHNNKNKKIKRKSQSFGLRQDYSYTTLSNI